MGVFQLMRSSFNVVKDFEQAQADLASVLNTSTDNMKGLTDQARELGGATTFTAAQVSELQKNLAKLGFSQDQIQDMTGSVLALAEATGTELAQAATVAGATLNGFGLGAKDSQRVVDVMAKSFTTSSLDMEKFSTAMAAVAPIAKTMGFSLEETTARLGVLTDSGLDASTAGTSLRNMMLEAQKQGLSWNEALDKVNDSQDKAGMSLELFGKRGVAAGVILAENQEKVAGLTDRLKDSTGAAEEMAKVQRDTLGGALKELNSAWQEFILGTNEAGGASDKLKSIVQSLTKNLGTILTVLGKVIKAFVIYKTVLFALKLKDKIKDQREFNKSLKNGAASAGKASKSIKAFGNALKSVGFALAVTVVLELAMALFDVASGAAAARKQAELLAKANDNAAKNISKVTEKAKKHYDERMRQIDLELRERVSAGEKEKDIALERIELEKKIAKEGLKIITDRETAKKKALDKALNIEDVLAKAIAHNNRTSSNTQAQKDRVAAVDAYLKQLGKGSVFADGFSVAQNNLMARSTRLTAEVVGLSAAQKEYNDLVQESIVQGKEAGGSPSFTATKYDPKRVNEETKAVKDLTDELIRQGEVERTAQEEKEAFDVEQKQSDIEKILKLETESAEKTGVVSANLFLQRLKEEEELRKAIIERIFLEDIDNATSAEDVILAGQRREQALKRLDDEVLQRKLDGIDELNDAQETYSDEQLARDKKIADEKDKLIDEELAAEQKRQEDLRNLMESFGNEVLDGLTERSKRKQALIDDEIAKEQQLVDALREGAQNGNAIASESLAQAETNLEAKERAKMEELKKEQQIEEIKAIWNALNNFLDGGDELPEATIKATTGVLGVKKLVENISGFYKGTKGRLGDENKAIRGGKDGHLIWADESEMIFNGGQVDELEDSGMKTTDDVVKSAVMFHQLKAIDHSNTAQHSTVDTSRLEGKIEQLTQVMKNKPEISFHPHIIQGMADGLKKTVKKGSVTNNFITHGK